MSSSAVPEVCSYFLGGLVKTGANTKQEDRNTTFKNCFWDESGEFLQCMDFEFRVMESCRTVDHHLGKGMKARVIL